MRLYISEYPTNFQQRSEFHSVERNGLKIERVISKNSYTLINIEVVQFHSK